MKKKDHEPEKTSRRHFLLSAAVGASLATMVSGIYRQGHIERTEPWGNTKEPPQQKQINDLYNSWYEKISQELALARKEGKKLAIVVGEHHKNLDSFLAELMIVDIASRLGIKDLASEMHEKFKAQQEFFEGAQTPELEAASAACVKDVMRMNPNFHGIHKLVQEWSKRLVIPFALRGMEKDNDDAELKKGIGAAYMRMAYNLKHHACDPLHDENDRACDIGKERENSIVTTLNAVGEDLVSINGGYHIKKIAEGLAALGTYRVLPLSAMNATVTPGFLDRNDPVAVRAREVDSSPIPKITIEGREAGLAEAWEMVMRASITHRREQAQTPGEKRAYNALYTLSEISSSGKQANCPTR